MKDSNSTFLFWASFLTLIAAGMGFSIRSDIMAVWGKEFHFTQTELGKITGMGLFGFGLTIIFFSFFADAVGYGKLMIIAFLLHAAAVLDHAGRYAYAVKAGMGETGAYWCLYVGQLCFSLGNGTCEAVINPLTASLYPKNKTHWLNILHAGWPGGLVLGVLVSMGLDEIAKRSGVPMGWMVRWGIVLAPVLIYGLMMVGRPFPHSEAKEHGISVPSMMGEIGMLGAAVAIGLLGLWMSKDVAPTFGLPNWAGWIPAGALWLTFGGFCGFRFGYVLLAGLYVLHALVRPLCDVYAAFLCGANRSSDFARRVAVRQRGARHDRTAGTGSVDHEHGPAVVRGGDDLCPGQDFLLADDAGRDLGAVPQGRGAGAGLQRRCRHAVGGHPGWADDRLQPGLCRYPQAPGA